MERALVSFLAIIDPVGNLIVFHLFTQGMSLRNKALAAALATVAAWLMLLLFSLAGESVLDYLSISFDSFRVAAGLLLMPPAYQLVMEGQPTRAGGESVRQGILDFALVPLATPLIAGPGALAATTSFAATEGATSTIAAYSIVLLISLLAFLLADLLFRLAGLAVLRLTSRIVGIVLFAIAVDFVLDGLRAFLEGTHFTTG